MCLDERRGSPTEGPCFPSQTFQTTSKLVALPESSGTFRCRACAEKKCGTGIVICHRLHHINLSKFVQTHHDTGLVGGGVDTRSTTFGAAVTAQKDSSCDGCSQETGFRQG